MNKRSYNENDQLPDHQPETSDWVRKAHRLLTLPFVILSWPLKLVDLFHDYGVDAEKEESWVRRTMRAVRSPFRPTDLFHNHGIASDRDRRSGWRTWGRLLLLPFVLVMLPMTLLTYPWRRGNPRFLWSMLPAATIVFMTAWIGYTVVVKSSVVQSRYYLRAQGAVRRGELDLAKKYFTHLMERRELTDLQTLQWSFLLANTGSEEESFSILDRLAPRDDLGMPEAHATQVIRFSNQLLNEERAFKRQQRRMETNALSDESTGKYKPDPGLLSTLKHHLEHANSQVQNLVMARALYLVHSQQEQDAFGLMDGLIEESPELYLTVASLGQQRDLGEITAEPLRRARLKLEARLAEDPLDSEARYLLVRTLIWLEDFKEAEDRIKIGMEIRPDDRLRKAIVINNLERYDQLPQENTELAAYQRLVLISNAIGVDRRQIAIYLRLTNLLMESVDQKTSTVQDPSTERIGRQQMKNALGRLISSSNSSAIDHCSLAYLRWRDGKSESAEFLLEQAWGLDDNFSGIGQRLALAFALQDESSGWAELLAKRSVEKAPELVAARVTLARIYKKQERYEDAIAELLEALALEEEKSEELYESLATMYQQVGNLTEAEKYRAQVLALKSQKAELESDSDEVQN